LDLVKYLLDQGADIDQREDDRRRRTPLHIALSHNSDAAMAKLLIRQGADLSLKRNDGSTPLHDAARFHGRPPVLVQLMCERGADPNARGGLQRTPLHAAVERGTGGAAATIIETLLEHGADPSLKGTRGKTPYDLATSGRASQPTRPLLKKLKPASRSSASTGPQPSP
jgi:ankyrin repeat protein